MISSIYIFKILLSYLGVEYEINQLSEINQEFTNKLESYNQFIKHTQKDEDYLLGQSAVISRYISNNHNFSGKSLQESARVDDIVESVLEIIEEYVLPIINSNIINEEITKLLCTHFNDFENQLSKSTFSAGGDSTTLADLYLFILYDITLRYLENHGYMAHQFNEKYPHLERLKLHFLSNKSVSEFINSNSINSRSSQLII
ncbi:hypothetical protein ACTFIV_007147 [Dictyostelium citrinum]